MTIQEWLSKNSFSDVVIKTHCSGVRLEIHERWKTTVSVVEANIDLAWKEALKSLPDARKRQAQKDIDKYQEWIDDKQKDIDDYKKEIEKRKKLLPKKRTRKKKED